MNVDLGFKSSVSSKTEDI